MNFQARMYSLLLIIVSVFTLTSCIPNKPPRQATTLDSIQTILRKGKSANYTIANRGVRNSLPSDVNSALMASSIPNYMGILPQQNEHRFNLAAHDVDARSFFMGLVKGTSYSMVVSPQVSGTISLDLKNVTVKEALQAVRDTYGFDYRSTAYGFEILPAGLKTHIFNVNYLAVNRQGRSETRVNGGQPTSSNNPNSNNQNNNNSPTVVGGNNATQSSAPSSVIETRSKSNFWETLTVTLKAIIGEQDGRSVIVDPDAGVVVIRAYPSEIREVSSYLNSIQSSMNREVIIDAKILEVQLNNEFQSGINWNILGFQMNSDNYRTNSQDNRFTNNIFTLHASAGNGDFAATIKLLSTEGNVQVLSSPRITTVNNQNAVIKVGSDEYFVTGISNLTVASAGSNNTQQNVNLTPFFSGIALDVTPQIDRQGDVVLHIHPTVSKVVDQQKTIQLGQTSLGAASNTNAIVLPLALSTIRESDSIVRAKSGEVIVIGGLMMSNMNETLAGAPFLSKLPIFGALFRDTTQKTQKSELVILLRPMVVTNNLWGSAIQQEQDRFAQLNRGFHYGDHPEIYGTLGEKPPYWERTYWQKKHELERQRQHR